MGIDPGTSVTGYGLIQINGSEMSLITLGIIELDKYGDDHFLKLKNIFEQTLQLIDNYHPDELAIEAPFFGKNIQSMLKLGRAQGVAMSAALYRSIPIAEYSPKKIKMAITGNGNASKEQVAAFVCGMLKIQKTTEAFDATDGLAAAICHFYQRKMSNSSGQARSWKEFISKNPKRVK